MPINSITELPESVRSSLTTDLQGIFLQEFNQAYNGICADKANRDQCSSKYAWAAVKKIAEKDSDGVWVRKNSTAEIQNRHLKSNLNGQQVQVLEKNDGLLVKNVNLLGTGEWTDSKVQTPLHYPPETLRKYADNWIDQRIWVRHSGGSPRSMTEVVADIQNIRYNSEAQAIKGDLFFHGKTQSSRDMIEYVKYCMENDVPLYVSVEHGGREKYNSEKRRYEASELVFGGAAIVPQGACKVCRINESADEGRENNSKGVTMTENEGNPQDQESENEYKLEDLGKELSELKDLIKEQNETIRNLAQSSSDDQGEDDENNDNSIKELEQAVKEQSDTVKELQDKIKKLENDPKAKTDRVLSENDDAKYYDPIVVDKGEITRRAF